MLTLAAVAARACPVPPPPVRDIDANSYYSDAKYSIIDPARKARNEAAVKPVNDFLDTMAKSANQWQAKRDPQDAACALGWLESWAEQDALLGKMTTHQSWFTRKWTLSGLALNYARVREAATPQQRKRIEDWFRKLADVTIAHADASKGIRNNHYYWEGLAITAVGAVTRDQAYLAWGRKVFDHAMGQIQPDGSLPHETARGSRALLYHLFSAAPLSLMASILDLQHPALDRLVRFSAAGVADPAAIARLAGVAQEKPPRMPGWIAYYNRHSAQPVPDQPPAKYNWDARMGGDPGLPNPLEHPRTAARD